MQKTLKSSRIESLTNDTCSPGPELPLEIEQVVPASFAAWLSKPSPTIKSEPETQPDIFLGLELLQ